MEDKDKIITVLKVVCRECLSALYEAYDKAPLSNIPEKAPGAIQNTQYVLDMIDSGKYDFPSLEEIVNNQKIAEVFILKDNYEELLEWAWDNVDASGNVEWDRMLEKHRKILQAVSCPKLPTDEITEWDNFETLIRSQITTQEFIEKVIDILYSLKKRNFVKSEALSLADKTIKALYK